MYRLGAWISWERNFTSRCRWNHSCWGSWGVKKCAGGAALASTRWPHAQYHLDGQPLLPARTTERAGVTWRIVWAGLTNYSVGRSLLQWCGPQSLHLLPSPIFFFSLSLSHTQTHSPIHSGNQRCGYTYRQLKQACYWLLYLILKRREIAIILLVCILIYSKLFHSSLFIAAKAFPFNQLWPL